MLKESLPLRGGVDGSPTTTLPAKLREIVTQSLSADDVTTEMATMSSDQLKDENHMLQGELNRVEELLSNSRAERDEIGIKYDAVSERVSTLTGGGGEEGVHSQGGDRMLQGELNRVEELLSNSRAERDEIGIKYDAVSERVSTLTRGGGEEGVHSQGGTACCRENSQRGPLTAEQGRGVEC